MEDHPYPLLYDFHGSDFVSDKDWTRACNLAQQSLHEVVEHASIGADLNWWLQSPASRNPFISPLYRNFSVIHFVNIKCGVWSPLTKGELIVASLALQGVLKKMLLHFNLKHIVVTYSGTDNSFFRSYFRLIRVIGGNLLRYLILGYPRLKKQKKFVVKSCKTLVDTFMLKGEFSGDRYYGNALIGLEKETTDKIYFVPEFLGSSMHELRRQKRDLIKLKGKYLLKESVLHLSDYFFAFYAALTLSSSPARQYLLCCGQKVEGLIEEELSTRVGFDQAVRGWLNYRFFSRLKDLGIKPNRIIDWFENQSIDKGWHKGVNDFYPECESIGYQAFPDIPSYFCLFPTESERQFGLLPKTLAIIGKGYTQTRTKYCKDLPIIVAPAFRYEYLWHSRANSLNTRSIVLVCLPIDIRIASKMLKIIYQLSREFWESSGMELRVRLHPATQIKSFNLTNEIKEWLIGLIESRTFETAIDDSLIFVGTLSSTCFEAMLRGKPIIVFYSGDNDSNTVPPESPKDLVMNFTSAVELKYHLNRLSKEGSGIIASNVANLDNLREKYFSRPRISDAKIFFGIE